MPAPPGCDPEGPTASTGYSAAPDGPDASGRAGGGGPGGRSWGYHPCSPDVVCGGRVLRNVRRESSQGRKAAALSGAGRVPQPTWPSHRASGRPTVRFPGARAGGPAVPDPENPSPPTGRLPRRGRRSGRHPLPVAVPTVPAATFAEVRGQDHVVLALRNAVRDDRVAHAYLFSGPRGTGKTSTARILAKALNCDRPAGRRALRGLRLLPRDHPGHLPRRPRARRRLQQRGRRHARPGVPGRPRAPRAAGRSTSSTRSTCCRRRRPTRC